MVAIFAKTILICFARHYARMKEGDAKCKKQNPIKVSYKESLVGNYFSDIVVENKVIIELKAASALCGEHEAQLINYLKATDIEVGLLLNFGKSPQFARKIFENKFK